MLYKATNGSKIVIAIALVWVSVQAAISLTGFYKVTTGIPPRFALLLVPPILFTIIRAITKSGLWFMATFDLKALTLLHIVRIPVELTLYWLYQHKVVPEVMTFSGRNFDILSGLSAPLVYYLAFVKKAISNKMLLGWNIVCLLLLANIVFTAVLSAPFSIQQFGFEQPNIALLYFPYTWLPCFIVPIVFMAHLVSIKKLAV
ncbi:hypothetical protein [Mucilaginibacter sp.]|uniref:hypothetical protein n=1 Tax=Mucilaginibacter sp. TaxID=1882438 RepID=UPI0035BBC6BB